MHLEMSVVMSLDISAARQCGTAPLVGMAGNQDYNKQHSTKLCSSLLNTRDVTDSESASESDGIWHFFWNPKSDGYLKSVHGGFTDLEIVDSVQFIYCLYNYFHKKKQIAVHWLMEVCSVFFTFLKTITNISIVHYQFVWNCLILVTKLNRSR